ncbi:MAG: histidine--tRNA ligase [Nitrospirae bacterium]|nr:histidine--tRNA ligase [Candidatus Troglogloeales bacterium]
MTESSIISKRLVEPQTLKGFCDHLPEEMIARNAVVEKIKHVYEKYGFLPLDTPILEHLVTLIGTGGEEVNKQLFKFESPEREPIAMRFDLTVPFARLLAQYPDQLKLPLRRYQIGPVFRADKPDPGRFRQFTQMDIDAAGSASVAVDAEMIAAMCEVMQGFGLTNLPNDEEAAVCEFQIRMNNRKLVDALLIGCGVTNRETQKHLLRVVDKLQKVGLDAVRKELGEGRIDDSGDPIRGVGLSRDVIGQIVAFIAIRGNTRNETILSLEKALPDSDASKVALQEMRDFAVALNCLKVDERDAIFDPSLARGLDYYTGPIFEAFLPQALEFGTVMGGGRYDQLVERFLDVPIPATGVSIGIDRLVAALIQLGKISPVRTTTRVLILAMPGISIEEQLRAVSELRAEHIPAEIYFGESGTSMRGQLSFASALGILIAVILGEDEIKNNQISIKNLKAGMESRVGIQDRERYKKAGKSGQITIPRNQLAQAIKEMLG